VSAQRKVHHFKAVGVKRLAIWLDGLASSILAPTLPPVSPRSTTAAVDTPPRDPQVPAAAFPFEWFSFPAHSNPTKGGLSDGQDGLTRRESVNTGAQMGRVDSGRQSARSRSIEEILCEIECGIAGAEFLGIQEGYGATPALCLFSSGPGTSTLALPLSKLNANKIRIKVRESQGAIEGEECQ
jgi:hypothetical protein